MSLKSIKICLIILCMLILATLIAAANNWDLKLAALFYRPGYGFLTGMQQPWQTFYRFGEQPAFIFGAAALAVWLAGFISLRLAPLRTAALFFWLLLVVGPGLLANLGFKEYWGRPRPREVLQLGGTMQFHQPWQPGPAPRNSSFPAGHPTAAFYMSSPYFVLRKKRPLQGRLWLWGGIIFGVLMGATRIIQGGHFLTDVIWSAGAVYLPAIILAELVLERGLKTAAESEKKGSGESG